MKLQRVPVGLPEISALASPKTSLWCAPKLLSGDCARKIRVFIAAKHDAEVFAVVRTVMKENDIVSCGGSTDHGWPDLL